MEAKSSTKLEDEQFSMCCSGKATKARYKVEIGTRSLSHFERSTFVWNRASVSIGRI